MGWELTRGMLIRMQTELPGVKIAEERKRRAGPAGAGSTTQRELAPLIAFPQPSPKVLSS